MEYTVVGTRNQMGISEGGQVIRCTIRLDQPTEKATIGIAILAKMITCLFFSASR
jgi:hypothetical protein